MIIINGVMVHRDSEVTEVISIISLSRFRDGGAAMFEAANINHHMDIIGVDDINPFIRNMLRVWDLSYVIFASENRADDDSPWAIIIKDAPIRPHTEFDIVPASISPICPTEE